MTAVVRGTVGITLLVRLQYQQTFWFGNVQF